MEEDSMSIEGFDYECALTGITSEGSKFHEEDRLDDLPPGWLQVSFKRRAVNPEYMALQQVKQSMVEGLMSQVPEDYPDEIVGMQFQAISMQVEAQFHAMESSISPYITYEEEVFVAPPESNDVVLEAVNEVRESFGLALFEKAPEEEAPEVEELEEEVKVAVEAPKPPKKTKAKAEEAPAP
tara:strand:- start:166 stop:711 length:546 start_codon:yes stop_codon:yes gene_type:complete